VPIVTFVNKNADARAATTFEPDRRDSSRRSLRVTTASVAIGMGTARLFSAYYDLYNDARGCFERGLHDRL